jgi:Na+/melibiose symporter-like transporter
VKPLARWRAAPACSDAHARERKKRASREEPLVDQAAAPCAAAPASLGLGTKLAYGFGAAAYGVKDNGFSYFLLIFYSQVVGLDPRLVGLAITIALVLDAFSDPIVGYWSDNLRSRWGRRHPFLYASAIPVAGTYFLLWAPPQDATQLEHFWRLLTLAILIRTFVTIYETPSSALAPELSSDYEERSRLLSYRFFFAWVVGNAMTVSMFAAIFPAFTSSETPGQFNRDSYALYGMIAAAVILFAILVSALGTHHRIPHLPPAPPARRIAPATAFREIFETLANRSFLALFLASILGAVATGLASTLAFYMLTYFWGFTAAETGLITIGVFVSAAIGAALAPIVTRAWGKKRAAMLVGVTAFVGSPLPIVLKLFGLLPDDPTFVFWFVFIAGMIDVGLIICFQILATAMMADLVEQAELKTGRRSEGVFFASITFVRKMVTGLGVMLASLILTLAAFPPGARPQDVSEETLWRLGAYYAPAILTLWMAMMAVISTYRITREGHEAALAELARRRGDS